MKMMTMTGNEMVSAKNGGYSAVFLWSFLAAVSGANTEPTKQDSRAVYGRGRAAAKRRKHWIRQAVWLWGLCRTSALVTDTRLPRSTSHQQYAAFDVWGEGELVKEGAGADAVCSVQHGEIGGEGFRVAGDIKDARKAGEQREGGVINACARRVNEDGVEVVGGKRNTVLLQAAEGALAAHRFAQFCRRKAGDGNIGAVIQKEVFAQGADAAFAHFGGKHAAVTLRERQGEVAVAAVEFEQVGGRVARLLTGPGKHLRADGGVWLAEAVFVLAVVEILPADMEGFPHEVAAEDDFLFAGAADKADAERGGECLCFCLPGVIQRAVIDEADHHLTRLRGVKFGLKETVAQDGTLTDSGHERGHQAVDGIAGRREIVAADTLSGVVGHGKVAVIPIMPDAKFRAHPVARWRRGIDRRRRGGERGEQGGKARGFFG